MEDDNLLHLLNQHHDGPKATTPIQPRREPLGEIVENDDHSSIVTMTCLNDRVPSDKVKRHFDDIRLVRPSSATTQGGSHTKRVEKVIGYPPHLVSGGNRNSTDNLIQSSIDVTLSSNSSREELQRQRPPPLEEEELAIVTIIGADDDAERENENPFDRSNFSLLSQRRPLFASALSNRDNSFLFLSSFCWRVLHSADITQIIRTLASTFHARRPSLPFRPRRDHIQSSLRPFSTSQASSRQSSSTASHTHPIALQHGQPRPHLEQ